MPQLFPSSSHDSKMRNHSSHDNVIGFAIFSARPCVCNYLFLKNHTPPLWISVITAVLFRRGRNHILVWSIKTNFHVSLYGIYAYRQTFNNSMSISVRSRSHFLGNPCCSYARWRLLRYHRTPNAAC